MNHTVRRAKKSDVLRIKGLAIKSFAAAYGMHNPEHIIDNYIEESFSLDKLNQEIDDTSNSFYLAESNGDIIGYLKLRDGTPPECISDANSLEIERIYADPDKKGLGIGRALIQAALDHAQANNYNSLWLGVWQENTPSVGFYKAQGFEIAGEKIFMMGDDPQKDHVMEKVI